MNIVEGRDKVTKQECKETLIKLKPNDKARAFDLVVERYVNSTNEHEFGQKVERVLEWCSDWFSE